VDLWAEEIADELGIKKEIYPAEVNQWGDEISHQIEIGIGYKPEAPSKVRLKGYKSRNIQIAEACDVLCCIVPHTYPPKGFDITNLSSFTIKDARSFHCIHCKKLGHPTNGGCFTLKQARKLNKIVQLRIIQ
jgi:hypothetical protein